MDGTVGRKLVVLIAVIGMCLALAMHSAKSPETKPRLRGECAGEVR